MLFHIPHPKKEGMAPGSVVFAGHRKVEEAQITLIDYDQEKLREQRLDAIEDALGYRDTREISWINVDGLHDTDMMKALGNHYGLHPLVLEDIVSTRQRPKVEFYDDYVFVVVRMLSVRDGHVDSEQVSIVLGPHWVLSFQERPGDVFDPLRERIRHGRGRLRKLGPDYLAYAILDVIVDNYFRAIEFLGEQVESLEDEILENPTPAIQKQLRDIRSELIGVRKAVWPLRELFAGLERAESPLISGDLAPFLRDAYDHAVQAIDVVESLRDVVSGQMDLYMTSISNRMNEIMKVLTIMGSIFIPLTFIAGIYGMNFEWMPELGYRPGYPIVWGVMLAVAGVLLVFFRRKRWI